MGAAAVAVRHVPQPTRSGAVASVTTPEKTVTLAAALASTNVSREALAQARGVSRPRVSQWADPDHEAEPNLRHIHAMPKAVRRAIGAALVESADAQVIPVPVALFERAVFQASTQLASVYAQVEAFRVAGDRKAGLALLREVAALRERLAALEAGVRVAMGAGK